MKLVNFLVARSLSGVPVDLRNRRVRLVYLDEAGISNPNQEPFLVVAGVILNADQDWQALDRHLKSLMRKWLPNEMRRTGIFHAKDIWHGAKEFRRDQWPLPKRMSILEDLVAIPSRFHLPVVHGFIERLPAMATLQQKDPRLPASTVANLIHSSAFIGAAASADMWMEQNARNEVAMLIAEDTGRVKEALKMFHDGYRQDYVDSYFAEIAIKDYPKNVFKTRNIIDAVHFASKAESPLLQIADTCAFFIKRVLQGNADAKAYFDVFSSQMVSSLEKNGQLSARRPS